MVKYRVSALPVRHRSQPRASTDVTGEHTAVENVTKKNELYSDISDICDI